eukprot:TRINITY_DN38657_c0_g1_i1.p1 TRINITY_DN38657_c0_g1~~TRINITY_DN38657_c0_g1_i1.p1  ORF type:complete len:792 (-),score=118.67 TRINITY_DN38657_c0_g1_i1:89-2464(-)
MRGGNLSNLANGANYEGGHGCGGCGTASVASSSFGHKVRLNVVALLGEGTVGKFLVSIDDDALVVDLASKIYSVLTKGGMTAHLLRLTNARQSHLPGDERVGDVLKDDEEVIAVLARESEDRVTQRQIDGGVADLMNFTTTVESTSPNQAKAETTVVVKGGKNLQAAEKNRKLNSARDSNHSKADKESARGGRANNRESGESGQPGGLGHSCPGPVEMFEEDLRADEGAQHPPLPPCGVAAGQDGHVPASMRPLAVQGGGDWSVEGLTPKLREFVSTRFSETHQSAADPGSAFITISMRPLERYGALSSTQPVQFRLARIDIIEFERLARGKVQELRCRNDYFQRCREALDSMSSRGASQSDYAENMLPYKYRGDREFGALLSEADTPAFGQVEGFRPVIVVDSAGAVGEKLVFVREALKRMLYSFLVAKSKFNLVKYSSQGRPSPCWEAGLQPPTSQKLRDAEDWLDSIRPVRGTQDFIAGMYCALQYSEADAIYVLTSGLPPRTHADRVLKEVRVQNVHCLPIHIIGVECEPRAELDLRRLAEQNHGSFRQKRFDGQPITQQPAGATVVPQRIPAWCGGASGESDDARLTIGGQLDILDIMSKESDIQTTDWLEEQKCANRLLLSTATQQPVPHPEQARAAAQRALVTQNPPPTPSRLQDLLEGGNTGSFDASGRRRPPSVPGGAPAVGARRFGAQGAHSRASSQPRFAGNGGAGGYNGGGVSACANGGARRPTIMNPWDRSGGPIRAPPLSGIPAAKGLHGGYCGSGPRPRPSSASTRRSSSVPRSAR